MFVPHLHCHEHNRIHEEQSQMIEENTKIDSKPYDSHHAIATELTITIKDDERTHKTKHLLYVQYTLQPDDPLIKELIGKALQDFNGEPTDVKVKASLTVL